MTDKKRTAVISSEFPEFIRILNSLNFETVEVKRYKSIIGNPESTHADMQILNIDNRAIILLRNNDCLNSSIIDKLSNTSISIFFTNEYVDKFIYPECVKLNIALVGSYAIGNFKYADISVLSALEKYHYNMINVKQGYAKCSTAIVSGDAIITSDKSIFNAMKNKIDCLKISEGHIALCKKYGGFIGGACFLLNKSTLAFMGDITTHPDYIDIRSFCKNHGVDLLSLSKSELFDVGGVVVI